MSLETRLHVLLVEDSPSDVLITEEALSADFFRIQYTTRLSDALILLQTNRFDVVLLDLGLPDSQGLETLRTLRGSNSQIAIVVLTGRDDESLAAQALHEGAQDYLVKGQIDTAPLQRAIRYAVERASSEQMLRRSEERFQELTAHIDQVLWVMDVKESKVVYVSQGYEKMWGRSRQSLMDNPQSYMDGIHPLDFERMQRENAVMFETGHIDVECRVLRPDGSVRWAWIRGYPVLEQGRIVRVVGVIEDVTDRKKIEYRILAQQAISRILAESPSLPDAGEPILRAACEGLDWDFGAIWQLDRTSQVLRCIRTWRRSAANLDEFETETKRLPYSIGSGLPGTVWDAGKTIWFADYARETNFPRTPIAARIGVHGAFGFPITLGGEFLGVLEFFSHSVQPRDQETVSMMTAVGSQIGQFIERKRAEEELRIAQQRQRDVVASSPAVLFTLAIAEGRMGGVSWISDNLFEVLGHRPEAALRPNWWQENVHPTELEHVIEQTNAELLNQGRTTHEYRFRHADGTCRWTRGDIRLIRDSQGRPVEAVGAWSDTSERKNLEEQFRQAQKMEAVGRLAGGIAHDFNNLLTVINGYSGFAFEMLKAGDPLHEMIDQIRKAGDRAATLTRQLLAFSRKQVLVLSVLDLNSLLKDMQRMLERLIGEDIDLVFTTAPDLWKIKFDPGQIEQVVMNLLVNARDAMPGGGKIIVETKNARLDAGYCNSHPDLPSGDYVMLAVSDTGCGMDEATKARIFEPFFSTKGEKGTGLGLATVFGIVKQSGGGINVYSEVGIGTTFRIYFPREKEPGRTRSQIISSGRPRRGNETILLVEDEEAVRTLSRMVLKNLGYTVLEARGGGEALLSCQQHEGPIHLVITDVVMPKMSGRQVVEHIRRMRPDVKTLYMSGYTDDAIAHHQIAESGVPFLAKPFSPDALTAKVREVLDAPVVPQG